MFWKRKLTPAQQVIAPCAHEITRTYFKLVDLRADMYETWGYGLDRKLWAHEVILIGSHECMDCQRMDRVSFGRLSSLLSKRAWKIKKGDHQREFLGRMLGEHIITSAYGNDIDTYLVRVFKEGDEILLSVFIDPGLITVEVGSGNTILEAVE